MSKAQVLVELVRQHLTAAAEEICGLFEAAMEDLEEETRRQCSLLEARVEPKRTGVDTYSLDVRKEEFLPKQQNRTSRLDQEDAMPSHVKKEHEQLQVSQDAVVTEFHPVPVKNEEDQYFCCSQTEKRIDCGQESHPDNKMTPLSQTETKLRCDKSSKAPRILSDVLKIKGCNSKEKAVCCAACGKRFSKNSNLKTHMRIHTGEKPFGCTFCSKRFVQKVHLRHHMTHYTGEKPLGCSTCDQRFNWLYQLKNHQCVRAGLGHREASEQVKASQTAVLGLNKYRNSLSRYESRETFTHKTHFKEPTQLHSAAEISDDRIAAKFFLGIAAAETKK